MKPVLSLVGQHSAHLARAQEIAKNLDADVIHFANVDAAAEKDGELAAATVVLLSATMVTDDSSLAGQVQVLKYAAPESWVLVIAEGRLKPESAAFLKKSGAQFVLLEQEYLETSKPEFVCSQRLHGEWTPVKSNEIKLGSTCPINIYHFMPLNRKFLTLISAGSVIDEPKFQKLGKASEIYIKRDAVTAYYDYLVANEDKSASGLMSRCRRQYMAMNMAYKDLVMVMTNQSEAASFQSGKELWDQVKTLADDFIISLGSVGEAWNIVNNAAFADFTPVDRAPAIAASAGLLSLLANIGNSTEVILAALLADVGLLELPPKTLMKWKQNRLDELSAEEKVTYRMHPLRSLNCILSRKIPVEESIREIILNTHERMDKAGFPNQPAPEKIPHTAMLVHLSEIMDNALKVDYGKERVDANETRKKVLAQEKNNGKAFPLHFLMQVEKALAES